MDFATDQGRTSPGAFQGVVVPAKSVVAVNIGEHVRRRDHVSATINARRGRIVVGKLQTRTQPRNGLLLTLGSPETSKFWDFPDGAISESLSERVNLYNPSKTDATVSLALTLEQGAAEPLELKVPAGDRLTLDPATEPRVPKGVPHALTLKSNVAIVAERIVDYAPGSGFNGVAGGLGATGVARQWLLPQGAASDTVDEYVTVHNTGRRTARVSIAVLADGKRNRPDGLQRVRVGAGERRTFRLADVVRGDLPLVVDATEPVVVERLLTRLGRSGVTLSLGIPVGTG
jgi:hypothetical protein